MQTKVDSTSLFHTTGCNVSPTNFSNIAHCMKRLPALPAQRFVSSASEKVPELRGNTLPATCHADQKRLVINGKLQLVNLFAQ